MGTGSPAATGQQSAPDIGKQWTKNWRIQKDDKSAVSKLSSTGKSIETIQSQLTAQQQANKELTEVNVKLKEASRKEIDLHKQQMIERDQKWKTHMDNETTAFATCMEQEKIQFEATTNQTIKAYEAMNDRLRFENETIKACCDSQAIQQAIMQQQIMELLA
jgi:hypothetical protein